MGAINNIYKILLNSYGPQGWWPVSSFKENKGYHPGNYNIPETEGQRFEIITGAILTQNTAWKNVRTALDNLKKPNLLNPERMLRVPMEELAEIIRPSGYFNQKAKKLKAVCDFLITGGFLNGKVPDRETLLGVWGIGPETADSILLYAYNVPVFVIDAYTKRIFSRTGLINADSSYDSFQSEFDEQYSDMSSNEKHIIFNEYHALIVKHAKEHCRKSPVCESCPVYDCKRLL